jgi:hypothetical protein
MVKSGSTLPLSQQPKASVDGAQELVALRALASGPSTKSRLAVQTFGTDGRSARSMMTRLSARLVEAGLAEVRNNGRERIMEITKLGGERLKQSGATQSETVPSVPKLPDALNSHEQHSEDRPRYHLRHAALLALSKLLRKPKRTLSDDRYETMLLTLAAENPDPSADAKADAEVFDSLSSGWNGSDRRKRLMECLVRFEDVINRRDAGSDLVSLGEKVEPGPEAILWSSAAIDLAHHYSFAPASQLDRLTARRLLRQSRELLLKSVSDPELAVAAKYRLEKASKVAALGWTFSSPVNANEPAIAASEDGAPVELSKAIKVLDIKVSRSGAFNRVLESLDRTLSMHLGRWIMSAMPSTEWVFRASGGVGIEKAIRDWGQEMGKGGLLNDLVLSQVRANPSLQEQLRGFISQATEFGKEDFGDVVKPHISQARALLGENVKVLRTQYDAMLLNNLWSPEMVAADAIAASSGGRT